MVKWLNLKNNKKSQSSTNQVQYWVEKIDVMLPAKSNGFKHY